MERAPRALLLIALQLNLGVIETTSLRSAAEFTQAHLHAYRESGEQTGYGGRRFNQTLDRVSGLKAVKDRLTPRTAGRRAGSDALLAAGRSDLTAAAVAARALAFVV